MTVNVVHVVRQYHPSIGGIEEVVRNIAANQLRSGRQHVTVISLNRLFRGPGERLAREEVVDGVPVLRLPFFGSSRYPICPGILRQIADADVIHVHGVDFFYDFLALTKSVHRKPLVMSTHGGFFHTPFAKVLKAVYFRTVTRWSAAAYARIIATSENDGRLFARIVHPPRLTVIENGVNIDKYADQAARTLQSTLIYFGRWSVNKGVIDAIEYISQLTAHDASWRLIIAGREYDLTVESLQAQVVAKGLTARVRIVPNPSDTELRGLIQVSSYFLCLSRHEGFGIAPVEGLSAGLTPVLSDIPPFRRLLDICELGLTVPQDDDGMKNSVDALRALHDQGQEAYNLRRASAIASARRYAWPAAAERYMTIYDQLGR